MKSIKLKYTVNAILLGCFKHRDQLGNLDVDRSQNLVKRNVMCGCGLNSVVCCFSDRAS
jgi:hypothetical protein